MEWTGGCLYGGVRLRVSALTTAGHRSIHSRVAVR